jgi:hypothetical protein
MKIAAAAVLFLAAVHCTSAHWLNDAAARSNSLQTTWRAAVSPRFQNVSRPAVVSMMGVPMQEHEKSLVSLPKSSSSPLNSALPSAFDVYEQWPQCTANIADQGIYHYKVVVYLMIGCGALLADRAMLQANAAPAGLSVREARLLTAFASQAMRPRCWSPHLSRCCLHCRAPLPLTRLAHALQGPR